MRWTVTGTALCVLFLTAACNTNASRPADGSDGVAITSAAIAAVALDHLPADPSSMKATQTDDTDRSGALGADLRYGADGESDGRLVRVLITPHADRDPCDGGVAEGCVRLPSEGGAEIHLVWEKVVPEEDPGFVAVVLQRDKEDVVVLMAGENIEGDPRQQALAIPVDTLVALVRDERLTLTTTQAVVDAGEDLDGWG